MLLQIRLLLAVLSRNGEPQEDRHERCNDGDGQARAEPDRVLGRLRGDVNIGASDATEVADGDEEGHADGAFG